MPHFVIGPDGTTSDLSTGFHTADQLLGELLDGRLDVPVARVSQLAEAFVVGNAAILTNLSI